MSAVIRDSIWRSIRSLPSVGWADVHVKRNLDTVWYDTNWSHFILYQFVIWHPRNWQKMYKSCLIITMYSSALKPDSVLKTKTSWWCQVPATLHPHPTLPETKFNTDELQHWNATVHSLTQTLCATNVGHYLDFSRFILVKEWPMHEAEELCFESCTHDITFFI